MPAERRWAMLSFCCIVVRRLRRSINPDSLRARYTHV
jgi:hypothetical protein